jgi:predicted membrane-bound spermidine synthase
MTIVAWICALFGGVLALAMSAGSAAGVVRRMDLSSALTVVPLPALAVYFSAPDAWAAIREKAEPSQLVVLGGPLVIGGLTLAMIALAVRRERKRQR